MKIDLSSIVENQLPQYVRDEFPLAVEFLKQYYISNTSDKITQNLDTYLDLDSFISINDTTLLSQNIDFDDDTIIVESTEGFSESYGLIKIDNEIITYISKTDTTFEGCIRGFSGIDSVNQNYVNFTQTKASSHNQNSVVENLSLLFLKEFFFKIKQKISPGFEDRELYTNLKESNFLKRVKDFYQSKGTESAFKILFGALFGKPVEMILPRDNLFSASNAQYRVTKKLVVESLEGNPKELINGTIYQDDDGFIAEASGTITYVESIIRNNKEYFIISLDFDYDKDINVSGTIKSDFTIHPKTISTSEVTPGSNYVDVDSTIGFPESGTLFVNNTIVNYTSKTLNQFLGCSGILEPINSGDSIRYDTYAYGYTTSNEIVKLRITGVLDEPVFLEKNYLFSSGDKLEIETLGYPSDDFKANSWKFNIPLNYDIKSISLEDSSSFTYKINTLDPHSFNLGDSFSLISITGNKLSGIVIGILNENSILINGQGELFSLNGYSIRKNLSKANFEDNSLNIYNSNIQNSFIDSKKDVYVFSPSLPTYYNIQLQPKTGKIVVTGTFVDVITYSNHPFYTGEIVVYKPVSQSNKLFSSGIYFVKRIDSSSFRLSTSRENLQKGIYLSFNATVVGDSFEFFELTNPDLSSKTVQPQNLIRKFTTPSFYNQKQETESGSIGIFNNGVELLNYKSNHQIFYGPIEKVIPIAGGSGYDLINPPSLNIIDENGQNADLVPSIKGDLVRIDLLDGGFDYLDEPSITIIGGNGQNAIAKANLIDFDHKEFFNSIVSVNLGSDTIGFTTFHKFRNAEQIIYNSSGNSEIGGLISNEKYFASLKTSSIISLHNTERDAILGINSINLTDAGSGIHYFQAVNKKKKISSITIINPGENYQFKSNKIIGINTFLGELSIKNHGFISGEIVVYSTNGAISNGLINNKEYYITVIDKERVKLSEINSTGDKDLNYKIGQFVEITSVSTSSQFISYPKINVSVSGKIGVTTFGNENYDAKLVPVFRGSIIDVSINNEGINYGSPEILDYEKQPLINVSKGSGAQIIPVINNGKISSVIIQSSGTNYNSQPDLLVTGNGYNAILTPVIQNGLITDVKIISGGFNYEQSNTSITVVSSGQGAKFKCNIKSWVVNNVSRFKNIGNYLQNDEGILLNAQKSNKGLEYYHLFAPKELRKSTYRKKVENSETIFIADLSLDSSNQEVTSTEHSPILGWAYDGNPIYGPYGYTNRFGGSSVRQLQSGYSLKSQTQLNLENRPQDFPAGFFVQDYEFKGTGDLDEHNGRFCVTPEFPNGIYAYFTTFDDVNSPTGFREPKFPYVIGDSFYSRPIDFNFNPLSNQSDTSVNDLQILRNTTPYNLNSNNTDYSGLILPYSENQQILTVEAINPSKIDKINVISSGDGYKIGDKITLSNENYGRVSKIQGKSIVSVASSINFYENFEFFTRDNSIIGILTVPHEFETGNSVLFTSYDGKTVFGPLKVEKNQLNLAVGLASTSITGIVTFANVYGDLDNSKILPNDYYKINNEIVKVLSVDKNSSRIKILRSVGLTSHLISSSVIELPRKFKIDNNVGEYSSIINNELYFNPKESVAVGLSNGVGIKSTLYFSNPGVGLTFVQVPTKRIYLPEHNLKTNDKIVYKTYNNSPISISTNGIATSNLSDGSELYVARFDDNLIGLSFQPIGIGTTGGFVGIGTNSSLLYFASSGAGDYHSIVTKYVTNNADIIKQSLTVSTASSHNLNINDKVEFNYVSGISTQIKIKFNDNNARITSNEVVIQGVDVLNNLITLKSHNFVNGEKVIYNSNSQLIGGLENNEIYYVIVLSPYKIALASTLFDSKNYFIKNISSVGDGTIASINPRIEITSNSSIIFDLSDSSLSYNSNGFNNPAFDFNLYYDKEFSSLYFNNLDSTTPTIIKEGIIGVTSSAKATLTISEKTPKVLYYKLDPLNDQNIPSIKRQLVIDREQVSHNSLEIKKSKINKAYKVLGFTTSVFNIEVDNLLIPWTITDFNNLKYSTNSLSANGGISEVQIIKNNPNNKSLPVLVNLESELGKGATIKVDGDNIGSIKSIKLGSIGFEYSIDSSIKPKLNLPKIIKTIPLFSIEKIIVDSIPINYYTKPELIIIDNYDDKVISDVVLDFNIEQKKIEIIKNTQLIRGTQPFIIPVNNSIGFAISNITFNNTTKDVTVVLEAQFSNISDFPFENGDKVLVENVVVGEGENNYNSSAYNYALFEIKNVIPNIGGSGASFTYSMTQYLNNDVLGTYNSTSLQGIVVPEKYFPKLSIYLKKQPFISGENIVGQNVNGVLIEENLENNYLKLLTKNTINPGQVLSGQSSNSSVVVSDVIIFESFYNTKSSTRVTEGWKRETGFLNNSQQRIHDNDYYQYFSYALKSEVNYNTWNDAVSDLAHPAGFKKFSNLIVYSETPTENEKENTIVEVDSINEITSEIDLNCIDNYHIARENSLLIDGNYKSNEIYLDDSILQDYVESISNKVIPIDSKTLIFSQETQPDNFILVDSYNKTDYYYKKYFVSLLDKWNPNKSSFTIVTTVQNETTAAIGQYSEVSLDTTFGYFDVSINNKVELQFFPVDFEYSSFYINSFSYGIGKNFTGISSLSLGNIADITYSGKSHFIGIGTTTIVGFSSAIRAAKIIVGYAYTDNSYLAFDEINLVHNGTTISANNYGELELGSNLGIGTYVIQYSGNNINVNLIPTNLGISTHYRVNSIVSSIKNTTFSGIGTTTVNGNTINSKNSTTTGISTEVFKYNNTNSGSYSIVCVNNTTNSTFSIHEFVTLYNPINNEIYYTEFGNVNTSTNLGFLSSYVKNGEIIVEFTPDSAASYTIRSINNIATPLQTIGEVGINSSFKITTNNNFYEAALFGSQKSFELTNQSLPILKREFNPAVGVSITSNTISLPNHFFVTGEEVSYYNNGSPIGIATTTIGVGNTTLLPSSLYVVKVDDNNIQVASAASFALTNPPKILYFTSLGIGTVHSLITKNQNNKLLMSLDNIIQKPVISIGKTTTLLNSVGIFENDFKLSNPSEIITGDLLKIDEEIVRVLAVGVGSTNICKVDRAKLGTNLGFHTSNGLVSKIKGNYNVINNIVYYDVPTYLSEEEYNFEYKFTGRVFNRSGIPNTQKATYYDNYIFDDVSSQFNGIKKSFTLKSNNSNTEQVSDSNAIVLINNVFQAPQQDYNVISNNGISTIVFTGAATSFSYDVNNASVPRGGIIVSVGSSQGLGYQPLVSAGGTAVVSAAGTIQSISIGNSGSGYRSGLQIVKVGVQTFSDNLPKVEIIGTANVSNGSITGVSITNPGIGYTTTPIKFATQVSSNISAGSTIIPIDYIIGINTTDFISVGSFISNARITGIGTTIVTIGSGSTTNNSISVGTTVTIKNYNPPKVIFDSPLEYSNISLSYVSGNIGVGTEATVSIIVGQGSSIISFDVINSGYGYKVGDVLTIPFGGSIGIPTDASKTFKPFSIKVEQIFNDDIAAWSVGDLQTLDSLDAFFDGVKRSFQLRLSNAPISLKSAPGSPIELKYNLLIFINDVLQQPDVSYTFNGGSIITFTEAPNAGDKSKVIFYRGTSEIDTLDVDIIEQIKIGDKITLNSENQQFQESERLISDITSVDTINTVLYYGSGISTDETYKRPISLCQQTEDIILNGKIIGKGREIYNPLIVPTAQIISNFTESSTELFVDNLRTFFDDKNEYLTSDIRNKSIQITSQDDSFKSETIKNVSYDGDFGLISGVKNGIIGVASTSLVFQFYIPNNSILRKQNYVNNLSGISTGFYFKISNSNIGNGIISLENNETRIGIGNSFIDNIYRAYSVSVAQTSVIGIGITNVLEVTTKVDKTISGVGFSNYYGNFSWGRIHSFIRTNPKQFNINASGISTSAIVQRIKPLKTENYLT